MVLLISLPSSHNGKHFVNFRVHLHILLQILIPGHYRFSYRIIQYSVLVLDDQHKHSKHEENFIFHHVHSIRRYHLEFLKKDVFTKEPQRVGHEYALKCETMLYTEKWLCTQENHSVDRLGLEQGTTGFESLLAHRVSWAILSQLLYFILMLATGLLGLLSVGALGRKDGTEHNKPIVILLSHTEKSVGILCYTPPK